MKRLTGKTSWYRRKQKTIKTQKGRSQTTGGERSTKPKGASRQETENKTPSSVLFVERTMGGDLAQTLRDKERELNKVGTKRVKVVERNGDQLGGILTSPNPWGEERCDRPDCLSCKNSSSDRGTCRDRNVVYQTTCRLCKAKGETVSYVGETARSLYERCREHLKDNMSNKTKSHMKEHYEESHGDETEKMDDIDDMMKVYEVKILERYHSSLQRQIGEAVHIRRTSGTLLNDKDEFNRCELPKLSVSKQHQKTMNSTRDREIEEETERFQEIRAETRSKRRDRPDRETETGRQQAQTLRETRKMSRAKRQKKESAAHTPEIETDDEMIHDETQREECIAVIKTVTEE